MKRVSFIIVLCLGLYSCSNGNKADNEDTMQSDTSLEYIIQTIEDTTQSYLDIKPELFALIDSMQLYTESNPNGKVRFAAKSFALTLLQLMMDTALNSPEELQFFMDSVMPKLDDVIQTWYVETSDPNEDPQRKTMVQYAIRREDNHNYVTEIDVHIFPEWKQVALYFPYDAVANPSIMFGNEYFELDTMSFHLSDALDFVERTDTTQMSVLFGESLLDAMLSHYVMFVGYVNNNEETDEITDRCSDSAIRLDKFQEQYREFQEE